MFFANGNRHSRTMKTAMIERIKRLLSSTRCEMKVSCVASGPGVGSLIGVQVYRGGFRADERSLRHGPRQIPCAADTYCSVPASAPAPVDVRCDRTREAPPGVADRRLRLWQAKQALDRPTRPAANRPAHQPRPLRRAH